MYDGMEHASAYYGKQTCSEVPEAYVEHMSITILVRFKRKVPKKIREVKINFIRVVYRQTGVSNLCKLLVSLCSETDKNKTVYQTHDEGY